jgi:hypothetical protein
MANNECKSLNHQEKLIHRGTGFEILRNSFENNNFQRVRSINSMEVITFGCS